jgi:glycosyltransferase involved in cell wall biosynthesis
VPLQRWASTAPPAERPTTLPDLPRQPRSSILYVVGSLEIGGTERHLTQIIPPLKSLGWQPIVCCLRYKGPLATLLEQSGIEVVAAPFQALRKLSSTLHLLVAALWLLLLLLLRRPTIVHFFLPLPYLVGAPMAIVARVPLCVMSRRNQNVYQAKYPFARRVEAWLHGRMQALVGNSKAILRDLIAEGAPPERLVLIYNGIETATHGPPPALSDSALSLIIVANLMAYKGHSDLFQALAQIATQLPPAWTLLCVGRDTEMGATLDALSRKLKLTEHIQFLGERSDIAQLLASADIGLLVSHEEGFSNAILEGMAAELPMIVTNVGGNAEAVVDGKTGLVVPSRDPVALSRAILRLASDRPARLTMGHAARSRVQAEFSLDRCVQDYNRLYQSLITKLKGRKP